MRRYAYASMCRQRAIMDYFGDVETLEEGCGVCDNCEAPAARAVDDRTKETVRILLSGVARLQGRFGAGQLVDLVTGSESEAILRNQHHRLPTYGRLKGTPKRRVQDLIQVLIRAGYLAQSGLRYPTLDLTDEGRDVMLDRREPLLPEIRFRKAEEKGKSGRRTFDRPVSVPDIQDSQSEILRDALRRWRAAKARELGMPPYTLFWDKTLDDLCSRRPQTPEDLLDIWGIGEQKRRLFGEELLSLIREHASA
jgi:ATP-dependent DNA helicase RecQ